MFRLLLLTTTTALFAFCGGWSPSLTINSVGYGRGLEPFYHNVTTHDSLCLGGTSHSGHIGLAGDSEASPKRSFFWYFEAQHKHEDAPVILTIGGGPGSSGMANPLFGQSHCKVTENRTTVANQNAWSENYNLVALDHPVGVGFSYGTHVNNSRAAAHDAYDFLVKFFHLFPKLSNNKLILAGGSYGGVYIPHIATVIHEQNIALTLGRGKPGAARLNLDALMVSNPMSDLLSHKRWALQQRCYNTDFYNALTCTEAFARLPACLEAVQMAYMHDTRALRGHAMDACENVYPDRIPGRSLENVNVRCDGSIGDCMPESVWAAEFMNMPKTKATLGVPARLNFTFVNRQVHEEFVAEGDMVQQAYLLYEPLLKAGYRLLHYIGKLDANCAWPGVLSMLRLIRCQYQTAFLSAPDLPWVGEDATVRAIGPGAGNFTYVLVNGAGHFVTGDQPALVKKILHHWVENVPFELEAGGQDASGETP
ncbi:serine carboxypeptidase-like protein [Phanerochaete sordida]|uniref:Serine carboxypeptidase-like protein n=1 Tax=Phanerochaete sordida TaxID=48140 RepID=A0A9P3G969_9APHY|nr:serine carboxypeptidase-like protein [Phanerochaete sordida]